jgi:hypothetical protein
MRPFALWRYFSQIHLIFQKEAAMKGAYGVKNACARFKRTFGDRLRAKREEAQGREASLACQLLNWMLELGRPQSYPVS